PIVAINDRFHRVIRNRSLAIARVARRKVGGKDRHHQGEQNHACTEPYDALYLHGGDRQAPRGFPPSKAILVRARAIASMTLSDDAGCKLARGSSSLSSTPGPRLFRLLTRYSN